jgi:hypothetical protein
MITERFTTFGPGSTWQRPISSANSRSSSQRRSSTSTRRAHGSTPPKPSKPILRKLAKSCTRLMPASLEATAPSDMRKPG